MHEKELETAKMAVKEAGKILLENFGKLTFVGSKSSQEVITNADYASEKKIISILKERFPEYKILSEEAGEEGGESDYLWIIDPLDGTTNYSINNPFFCISLGLIKDKEAVLGVVYSPVTGELFYARKGEGAFLNGKRIAVSDRKKLQGSLAVYCHGYNMEDLKRIIKIFGKIKPLVRDFNRMRAGALELAFVAAGRLVAYVSAGTRPWDVAAGALLVREAGGKITDFNGNKWNLDTYDILATNGHLHEEFLKKIKE